MLPWLLICPGCGRAWATRRGACERCWREALRSPLLTPALVALGRYQGALAAIVRAAKYRPSHALLDALGTALGAVIVEGFAANAGTSIVAVPPDPGRRRARGTDHAQRLAEAVARASGLPVAGRLLRVRATQPQSRIARTQRERNVAGAIVWPPDRPRPARVILIDDVATSGATLRACRAALGGEVRCAVVAAAAALSGATLPRPATDPTRNRTSNP
jgi:predicted amidophosphoribosyltransferase